MQYDTAGNPTNFYDMCGCCQMDTGGKHQSHCPLYQPPQSNVIKPNRKAEIDAHPEWGIKYL